MRTHSGYVHTVFKVVLFGGWIGQGLIYPSMSYLHISRVKITGMQRTVLYVVVVVVCGSV